MPAERWGLVERLYHDALAAPAASRGRWLDEACGGDAELRAEVEALVSLDEAASAFLERPALAVEADALARSAPALTGRRLGDYEVLGLLGSGGMGDVYRARDVRLRREVALKTFAGPAAHRQVERIEAEARAASALVHPGIVTVYGVGDEDDVAWIAMELVRGRSLRAIIGEGPLPLPGALDVAIQLAEAVAAAHARGIVHRDLKPENVMVTVEGQVKVLDFGIARVEDSGEGGPGPQASEASTQAGTVAYLSPEQARGLSAGPAGDQFAVGVILYEMLTGRRPFDRPTARETRAAIASPEEAPAVELGDSLGPLARVAARCIRKDPSRRHPDCVALAAALRVLREPSPRGEGVTRRRVLAAVALSGVAAGAALAWRGARPRLGARRSFTVLPFANPAGDDAAEYLCDGLAETLIRQLAGLPGVAVTARATAFSFKGRSVDPRAIGRQLGVQAVLSGSVRRRGGRVIFSAELVDAASGARLWGGDYDNPAADVLAVQGEIAEAILREGVQLSLDDEQRRRLARSLTDDAEAYDLFLRGVHHLRLETEDDYVEARSLLVRAVERAPRFALALTTLASTFSVMAVDGYEPPAPAWAESERLVARALAVDPEQPDAHAEAAAAAFFYRWDWPEAESRWRRAFALRREVQPELLAAYALQRWALGDSAAALEAARAARQADPLSALAAVREADLVAALGRLAEARTLYERLVRQHPEDPRARFGLAEVLEKEGRFDEAIACRRLAYAAAGDTSLQEALSRARGAPGCMAVDRAAARLELSRLEARASGGGYVSPLDLSRALARLGDVEEAFRRLDVAIRERSPGLALLRVDPAWRALRGEARFASALSRVGLP